MAERYLNDHAFWSVPPKNLHHRTYTQIENAVSYVRQIPSMYNGWSVGTGFRLGGTNLAYSLLPHLLGIANGLVRSALDNTAGPGQLGTDPHEVGVYVPGCLATLIDTPT